MDEPQLTWHDHSITREQREALNGHRGCVVWFVQPGALFLDLDD